MKPITYVTFILFAFNIFFAVGEYEQKFRPVTLTHSSLKPVFLLFNSKLYLQEHNYKRSSEELKAAIAELNALKTGIEDAKSLELINLILPDLVKISKKGDEEHLRLEKQAVNEQYVKMLLALTYMQVRHALECCDNHDNQEMIVSLKRAMGIVRKALIISEGSKKDHEVIIYSQMNAIVRSRIQQQQQIRDTLQQVLQEIEGMQISFTS